MSDDVGTSRRGEMASEMEKAGLAVPAQVATARDIPPGMMRNAAGELVPLPTGYSEFHEAPGAIGASYSYADDYGAPLGTAAVAGDPPDEERRALLDEAGPILRELVEINRLIVAGHPEGSVTLGTLLRTVARQLLGIS